jgi:hypothetical protein
MTASQDRRYDQRFACKIPIVVSRFNSKYSMEALLLDYCMNGISFKSGDAFLPGTAIIIRIAYRSLNDSHSSDLQQLPSIRIGEVKWCDKLFVEPSTAFKLGIKDYHLFY